MFMNQKDESNGPVFESAAPDQRTREREVEKATLPVLQPGVCGPPAAVLLEEETAALPMVFLPSRFTTIRASAMALMQVLGETGEVFRRGREIVTLHYAEDGAASLESVSSNALRSLSERFAQFVRRDLGKDQQIIETPRLFSSEDARGICECQEAIRLLPEIRSITSFPLMRKEGRVSISGYDRETRVLVTSQVPISKMSREQAVEVFNDLLRDWQFATPSDKSRAIAMILAPMLRLGIWLGESVVMPIFTVEANASQTGKGMLVKVISEIYGEHPSMVVQPRGGVGSFDELFGRAVLAGRPLVLLDNLRGRIDSQILESFTTAGGQTYARALRSGGEVDSRYYVIFATSNGFESTEDVANRMCMVRIVRQREGYEWHEWPEGSLLKHVRQNRELYLGAVCAVFESWIEDGMPSLNCPHDAREWAGAMNWITQQIFNLPPLMEGHADLRERVSKPVLGFLREIALHVKKDDFTLCASKMRECAGEFGIAIPDLKSPDQGEKQELMHLGKVLNRVFSKENRIEIEGYAVERVVRSVPRADGEGSFEKREYRFCRKREQEVELPKPPPPIRMWVSNFSNIPPRPLVAKASEN